MCAYSPLIYLFCHCGFLYAKYSWIEVHLPKSTLANQNSWLVLFFNEGTKLNSASLIFMMNTFLKVQLDVLSSLLHLPCLVLRSCHGRKQWDSGKTQASESKTRFKYDTQTLRGEGYLALLANERIDSDKRWEGQSVATWGTMLAVTLYWEVPLAWVWLSTPSSTSCGTLSYLSLPSLPFLTVKWV